MPNLASILKDEIRRLAKKEIKSNVAATKRAATQHRRDIAELKRLVKDQARRIAFLESQEKRRVAKPIAVATSRQVRFSSRWLKAHRQRLGLSAADYGKLIGVSGLTVYNWENGKAKPRQQKVRVIAALRKLRKREALKRLEMMGG